VKRYPGIKELARLTKRGRYAVGHGAFLQISEWDTRSWVFRYVRGGKAHHIGMGSAEYVTLAEARQRAYEYRRLLAAGGDPLQQKQQAKRERLIANMPTKTFKAVALDYIAQHEDGWRGDHSRKQWLASLQTYAFPKIGDMAIVDVDVAAVLSVLDPIWREIPETAGRVKHRIALILDWAAARDLRPHDNPARRPKLLPKRKKRAKHFEAMPYAQLGGFMAALRTQEGLVPRALEFLVLTATRTGEVMHARWSEINGDTWTIPGERTKTGRDHRVPLSAQAQALLSRLPRLGEYVFPGARTGARMSENLMRVLLRAMGAHVTVHGFRSSFRDWAAEQTSYANHVVEMALAHAIGNGVEEAYRRGDLFEKRARLMQDWARYCSQPARSGEVVTLHKEVQA
jgi:integrase